MASEWILSRSYIHAYIHNFFLFYLNLSHDLPITYRNWISFLKYDAHFFYWDIWVIYMELECAQFFFYIFYSFNNSWPFFALFFFKSFMHFNATLMIVKWCRTKKQSTIMSQTLIDDKNFFIPLFVIIFLNLFSWNMQGFIKKSMERLI